MSQQAKESTQQSEEIFSQQITVHAVFTSTELEESRSSLDPTIHLRMHSIDATDDKDEELTMPNHKTVSVQATNLSKNFKSAKHSLAAPLDRKPSKSIADFELLTVLGRGAYGKVFQVRHTKTGDILAMKVMQKNEIVERNVVSNIKSERLVLEAVSHPFIVSLRYAFQSRTKLYLLMNYVAGGEMFTRLDRGTEFTERDAKFYVAQITLALEYLHSRDIIYRDLKPENVLFTEDGNVNLTDFGFARAHTVSQTESTSFCGTVQYMAPEVVSRSGHGKPADWWALGCLLYEMLTSKTPFHGPNRKAIQENILKKDVVYPKYFSPQVVNLLRGLLARDPTRRFKAEEVKKHAFFSTIDWKKLLHLDLVPPFVPKLKNATDVSNFDERFTAEPPIDSPPGSPLASARKDGCGSEGHDTFADFSYGGDSPYVPPRDRSSCSAVGSQQYERSARARTPQDGPVAAGGGSVEASAAKTEAEAGFVVDHDEKEAQLYDTDKAERQLLGRAASFALGEEAAFMPSLAAKNGMSGDATFGSKNLQIGLWAKNDGEHIAASTVNKLGLGSASVGGAASDGEDPDGSVVDIDSDIGMSPSVNPAQLLLDAVREGGEDAPPEAVEKGKRSRRQSASRIPHRVGAAKQQSMLQSGDSCNVLLTVITPNGDLASAQGPSAIFSNICDTDHSHIRAVCVRPRAPSHSSAGVGQDTEIIAVEYSGDNSILGAQGGRIEETATTPSLSSLPRLHGANYYNRAGLSQLAKRGPVKAQQPPGLPADQMSAQVRNSAHVCEKLITDGAAASAEVEELRSGSASNDRSANVGKVEVGNEPSPLSAEDCVPRSRMPDGSTFSGTSLSPSSSSLPSSNSNSNSKWINSPAPLDQANLATNSPATSPPTSRAAQAEINYPQSSARNATASQPLPVAQRAILQVDSRESPITSISQPTPSVIPAVSTVSPSSAATQSFSQAASIIAINGISPQDEKKTSKVFAKKLNPNAPSFVSSFMK